MWRIISDVLWLSDIRKVRGDYDSTFALMTGPQTHGCFADRKLTHFITTKHFPQVQRKYSKRKWVSMVVSFRKTNMFFVCFIEVCVFSNPSGEHALPSWNQPSRFRLDITKVCYGFSHSLLFITVQSSRFKKNFLILKFCGGFSGFSKIRVQNVFFSKVIRRF